MGQIVSLSLLASLNPTLVAATTVMLLLERPVRLMTGYLLGACTASLTCGMIIVFALPHSSTASTTQHTLSPLADIALGTLALAVAFVLYTGRHERLVAWRRARKERKGPAEPPRWQRELSKGSPRMTFAVGILLTLPGASYLLGLNEIHKQNASTAATIALVIGFNVVMLWLLEVPLAAYKIAPAATPRAIEGTKAWIRRHAHRYAIRGFAGIGLLLVIKGIVELVA
jgi:Sap, sulfolipid-1-addressing protein